MEHKDIPNDGLHEPKDIVFAAPGTVYVADGNGSGTWTNPPMQGAPGAQAGQVPVASGSGGVNWAFLPTGWGLYDDTASPFVVNTSPTPLSIDGDGPLSEYGYLPATGDLWEQDRILFSQGGVYGIELVFDISSLSGATSLSVNFAGEMHQVAASTGVVRLYSPLHTFNSVDDEILVSTDSGTLTITDRKIKIVQLYGAM